MRNPNHPWTTEAGAANAILDLLDTPLDDDRLEPGPRLAHLDSEWNNLSSGEQHIVDLATDFWTGRQRGVLFLLGNIDKDKAAMILAVLAYRLGIEDAVASTIEAARGRA